MRRTSSLLSLGVAIDREIDSDFDDVKAVARITDEIVVVAGIETEVVTVAGDTVAINYLANNLTDITTKLDGIEDGATADQTGAEIKIAYEGELDTNAYSDADKEKLANILVTQAVDLDTIESDTITNNAKETNISTDLSYTPSATVGTVVSSDGTDAIIPVVVAGGNSGILLGSDKTKLDLTSGTNTGDEPDVTATTGGVLTDAQAVKFAGIETGADVTSTNETSHADVLVDADIGTTIQAHSTVLDATTASFTTAEETKLSTVEQRANHTGTQLASTISDLGTAIDTQIDSRDINTLFKLISINTANLLAGAGSITHANATGSTYINRRRVLKTAEIDEVVYESEGMRGSCPVTTYARFSEDCTGAGWAETNLGLSTQDGTLGPDGTSEMWKIIGDGTTNYHYIDSLVNSVASDDETWTNSIFIKKSDADVIRLNAYFTGGSTVTTLDYFTFSTKSMSLGNFDFEELANGIFRVWRTLSNNATGNTDTRIRVWVNDGTNEASSTSVYVWGSMMTPKAFLTPYVKTIDVTAVTASGDIMYYDSSDINIPDLTNDWSMKWTGTPYFEVGATVAQQILYNYTDSNNYFRLYIYDSRVSLWIVSGGTPKSLGGTGISDIVSGTTIDLNLKCVGGTISMNIDDIEVHSNDFSAVLDVPIADKTYIASGVATPNSNSIIYTKSHSWEEL